MLQIQVRGDTYPNTSFTLNQTLLNLIFLNILIFSSIWFQTWKTTTARFLFWTSISIMQVSARSRFNVFGDFWCEIYSTKASPCKTSTSASNILSHRPEFEMHYCFDLLSGCLIFSKFLTISFIAFEENPIAISLPEHTDAPTWEPHFLWPIQLVWG